MDQVLDRNESVRRLRVLLKRIPKSDRYPFAIRMAYDEDFGKALVGDASLRQRLNLTDEQIRAISDPVAAYQAAREFLDEYHGSWTRRDQWLPILRLSARVGLLSVAVFAFSMGFLRLIPLDSWGDLDAGTWTQVSAVAAALVAIAYSLLQYLGRASRLGSDEALSVPDRTDLRTEVSSLRRAVVELQTGMTASATQGATAVGWVREIKAQLGAELGPQLLSEMEARYSEQVQGATNLAQVRERFKASENRLARELADLRQRGNLNLVIGVMTTLIAIGALIWLVLSFTASFESANSATRPRRNVPAGSGAAATEQGRTNGDQTLQREAAPMRFDWKRYLVEFLPRLSVAIFIEVFAFFFLRLYRATLVEAQHYHRLLNEFALLGASIELALLSQDRQAIAKAADRLRPSPELQQADGGVTPPVNGKDIADLMAAIGNLVQKARGGK